MFTAWEVAKAVPLFGFDVYAEMVRANGWVARYLPNALPEVAPAPPARKRPAWLSRVVETAPYQWLEAKEKARKYSSDRRDVGIDMNERAKQGSMDRHSPTRSFHVMSEVRYRLERLGLQMHPVYPELVAATKVLATEMKHWPTNGATASNGASAHV